jgi:uncharacterized YccA/Bax inhibitor family protein
MMGGLIAGFVFSLVTVFKKEWSPITAPIEPQVTADLLAAMKTLRSLNGDQSTPCWLILS